MSSGFPAQRLLALLWAGGVLHDPLSDGVQVGSHPPPGVTHPPLVAAEESGVLAHVAIEGIQLADRGADGGANFRRIAGVLLRRGGRSRRHQAAYESRLAAQMIRDSMSWGSFF